MFGIEGRVVVIGDEVAAVDGMPGALQPVGAADVLILVVRIGNRIRDPPARIGGERNQLRERQRGRAEAGWTDHVIREWLAGSGVDQSHAFVIRLARRRVYRAEVSIEHGLRGNEGDGLRRRRPRASCLVTGEDE